jgi:hypothetical protein
VIETTYESVYDLWIKLFSSFFLDHPNGFINRPCFLVASLHGQGIKHIRHTGYTRFNWYFFTAYAMGVSLAVVPFVM